MATVCVLADLDRAGWLEWWRACFQVGLFGLVSRTDAPVRLGRCVWGGLALRIASCGGWYVTLNCVAIVEPGRKSRLCTCEFWVCGVGHMWVSNEAVKASPEALVELLEAVRYKHIQTVVNLSDRLRMASSTYVSLVVGFAWPDLSLAQ